MLSNKLISVIVPVYKVEKYLSKCIESILNQTFQDFELILVDDGSPDNCGMICDKYAEIDPRIRVIHKKNGGLSEARNAGISIATGDYLTFIDSDDFIDSNYLKNFMDILSQNDSDLIITGIVDFYENDTNIEPNISEEFEVLSREQVFKKMLLQDDIDVNATAKLYKKAIFENIKYPVGELYEDIKIIYDIVESADTIIFSKYKGYFYLQRIDSIMYSNMSSKKLMLLDTVERLKTLICEKYPNIKNAMIRRYVYCHFHILGRAIFDKNYVQECKRIRKNILNYQELIFYDDIFSKKEKIATLFLKFGLIPYKTMWWIFCKIKGKSLN